MWSFLFVLFPRTLTATRRRRILGRAFDQDCVENRGCFLQNLGIAFKGFQVAHAFVHLEAFFVTLPETGLGFVFFIVFLGGLFQLFQALVDFFQDLLRRLSTNQHLFFFLALIFLSFLLTHFFALVFFNIIGPEFDLLGGRPVVAFGLAQGVGLLRP